MKQNEYISTSEAAALLGSNRTQVFRLIKSGKIPAVKIGRNYAIKKEDLGLSGGKISQKEKEMISQSVRQVIKEYGDVIKKLGDK